jgi:hypothetical protein
MTNVDQREVETRETHGSLGPGRSRRVRCAQCVVYGGAIGPLLTALCHETINTPLELAMDNEIDRFSRNLQR